MSTMVFFGFNAFREQEKNPIVKYYLPDCKAGPTNTIKKNFKTNLIKTYSYVFRFLGVKSFISGSFF